MGDDVLSYVKKFLASSGFPLEMQVASTFAGSNFEVEQARPYLDVNTDALREIDVLATARRPLSFPAKGWTELRLVVECKHSDKPWLMFIGNNRFTRSQPHFESLDIMKYQGAELAEARSADELPIISHVGEIAYRVSTAGPRDDAFAAVQQVNSAVLGVKRDLVSPEDYKEDPLVVVLVPVLVTDSPLVECRLDRAGEVTAAIVENGLLLTRLRAEDRLHSVWIVSEKGLDQFVSDARKTADNMSIIRPGS